MQAAGARLLRRAQDTGQVRADVSVYEGVSLALGLAWAAQQPGGSSDLMCPLLSTAMSASPCQQGVSADHRLFASEHTFSRAGQWDNRARRGSAGRRTSSRIPSAGVAAGCLTEIEPSRRNELGLAVTYSYGQ